MTIFCKLGISLKDVYKRQLELYVVDSDGNKSNREKLTLTVQ